MSRQFEEPKQKKKRMLRYAFILALILAVCGFCYPLFKLDALHDKQFFAAIIIVLAVFVIVEIEDRFSRWWRGQRNTFWKMTCSYKAKAVVRVSDMDEKLFSETLHQFCVDNGTDEEPLEKPARETNGRTHVLRFSNIDFDLICFLVNNLVYSERGHRHDAKAWYELGPMVRDDERHPLSGQKVMFFVPEDDDEYDNVYFVTSKGHCFKYSFAGMSTPKYLPEMRQRYEPQPL